MTNFTQVNQQVNPTIATISVRQVELALECYVMSYLHTTVFSELCYIYGAKDNALNKTLRNLSQVKPQQLDDLNSVYFASLPTARHKMGNLNMVFMIVSFAYIQMGMYKLSWFIAYNL